MKVLVVEDDAKLARFITRILDEEGYVAESCASGSEALERVADGAYDLLILDWMLPDIDGVSVCRELRERRFEAPILMLTARGELRERVLGLGVGADDYMVKPFEIEELLARMHALLRRTVRHGYARVGPLHIDHATRRVLLDGAPLELSARESKILLHLVLRVGEVVTREELRSRVWELGFEPESNAVEVQISRLRGKLGRHADLLETVRGQGYRLRAD
ncbi:MAG: response regulator transcription factor [Enhygromyxa sp.]